MVAANIMKGPAQFFQYLVASPLLTKIVGVPSALLQPQQPKRLWYTVGLVLETEFA